MSYEAALEAMLVLEKENGGGILCKRVIALMKKTKRRTGGVDNFTRRVFWLRSKVAHGARPIREIENLILHKLKDAIVDNEWKKTIRGGNYASLLITSSTFPGFLVNLRELARSSICFFCDEFSTGRVKADTIRLLDKTD